MKNLIQKIKRYIIKLGNPFYWSPLSITFYIVFAVLCAIIYMDTEKINLDTDLYNLAYPAHAQVIESKKESEKSIQEQVWQMLEGYGLSFEERVRAVSIIQCESGWNQYAINKNTDGSFDTGLWQINNKIHGKSITRGETFDVEISTKYAMELYKKHGWKVWICNK